MSSLICDRWLQLNLEAYNCCQEDTDAAIRLGGARCLACHLPSCQFARAGMGKLPWYTPVLSGAEKQPWYRLGALASISTKPLQLTNTHTHTR